MLNPINFTHVVYAITVPVISKPNANAHSKVNPRLEMVLFLMQSDLLTMCILIIKMLDD